ncbi:MAG: hypothetical protein RR553_04510 [Akkermansia sp.]
MSASRTKHHCKRHLNEVSQEMRTALAMPVGERAQGRNKHKKHVSESRTYDICRLAQGKLPKKIVSQIKNFI